MIQLKIATTFVIGVPLAAASRQRCERITCRRPEFLFAAGHSATAHPNCFPSRVGPKLIAKYSGRFGGIRDIPGRVDVRAAGPTGEAANMMKALIAASL